MWSINVIKMSCISGRSNNLNKIYIRNQQFFNMLSLSKRPKCNKLNYQYSSCFVPSTWFMQNWNWKNADSSYWWNVLQTAGLKQRHWNKTSFNEQIWKPSTNFLWINTILLNIESLLWQFKSINCILFQQLQETSSVILS